MKEIFFSGASDDLVHVEGFGGLYHEVDCYGSGVHLATFNTRAGGGGFAVTSLNEADDFRLLPDWPTERLFGSRCAYFETLRLVAPDEATIGRMR